MHKNALAAGSAVTGFWIIGNNKNKVKLNKLIIEKREKTKKKKT